MAQLTSLLNRPHYVVRAQYGDESLALLAYLHATVPEQVGAAFTVVDIDTGFEGEGWLAEKAKRQAWVQSLGFHCVTLPVVTPFADLIRRRQQFPSPKFQWCATVMKGMTLEQWLDQKDPEGAWGVLIAKRQCLTRKPIPERLPQCELHGEREVLHPIVRMDLDAYEALQKTYQWPIGFPRSWECQPCVHSMASEVAALSRADQAKVADLEAAIQQPFFSAARWEGLEHIEEQVLWLKQKTESSITTYPRDPFAMGCADPYGCGL